MKLYGLIGYPVQHSLSGLMHNAAFKHLGIDAEYRLFEVKPQDLGDFIKSLAESDICGLNVTIPHKQAVLKYLHNLDEEAGLIEAVNTVRVEEDGRLTGFNTDGLGFIKRIKELGFVPQGRRISLIGAGGAAKAISIKIAQQRPQRLLIYDIDILKRESLVSFVKKRAPGCLIKAVEDIEDLDIRDANLLINATPVGMKQTDPCLVKEDLIHRDLLVYDLIYNPPRTKLLSLAQRRGAKIENGLKMLLYQGELSFKIWTFKDTPRQVMEKALLGALKNG